MSEERFDRIDERFDGVDQRFDRIDERFERTDQRLERLETGVTGLKGDIRSLDGRVDELGRHMGVLHEEAMDRIKATRHTGPTKAEMDQGFADLREAIERRLDPLEATVRHHTAEIKKLKQGRH